MAPTPGQLVRFVAEALEEPEPTVTQHDRNLFAANLRTKGGRGPSAAKTSSRDAAHLITAVLGTRLVKDSAQAVQRYAATRVIEEGWEAYCVPELARLPAEHSFLDALEALLLSIANGSFDQAIRQFDEGFLRGRPAEIRIAIQMPTPIATIGISAPPKASRFVRYAVSESALQHARAQSARSGRRTWQEIETNAVRHIAGAFRETLIGPHEEGTSLTRTLEMADA